MGDGNFRIFDNLPRRKLPRRKRGYGQNLDAEGYDSHDRAFREVMGYEPEGPLPPQPRPHPSGKGGPSVNQTAAVVSSVWSAADAASNGMMLSNGGLTVTPSGVSAWQSIGSSVAKSSGKLYVEFKNSATVTSQNLVWGIATPGYSSSNYFGSSTTSAGFLASSGGGFTNNFAPVYGVGPITPGSSDVWAFAIDFAGAGPGLPNVWIAKNNVWFGAGNPSTGVNEAGHFTAAASSLFVGLSFFGSGVGVWTLQATAASQTYAPPAGFTAWG